MVMGSYICVVLCSYVWLWVAMCGYGCCEWLCVAMGGCVHVARCGYG